MTERIAVLGVDPSLRGLAAALHVEGLPVHEHWQKSTPIEGLWGRALRNRTLVDPVAELARQARPRLVVVEGYSMGNFDQYGNLDRAELGGVLRDHLRPHAEMLIEVAPTSLKKFVTGFGGGGALPKELTPQQRRAQLAQRRKDSKGAVKRALEAEHGRVFKNDDAADAFALLQIGLCLCGLAQPSTDAQREVLKGLRAKAAA